jgi:hypothetical protein
MRRHRGLILTGLAIALLVVGAATWFASAEPDGLERVAEDQAFAGRAQDPGYEVLPDYTVPGIEDERLSTLLAGAAGVVIVALLAIAAGALLRRRSASRGAP